MADGTIRIVGDISHLLWQHGQPDDWYVGVSDDPKNALLQQHGVREEDPHIVRETESAPAAAEVATFFVSQLSGCGDPKPKSDDEIFVYAYLKAPHTSP